MTDRFIHMYPAQPHTVMDTKTSQKYICADENCAQRLTDLLNALSTPKL